MLGERSALMMDFGSLEKTESWGWNLFQPTENPEEYQMWEEPQKFPMWGAACSRERSAIGGHRVIHAAQSGAHEGTSGTPNGSMV